MRLEAEKQAIFGKPGSLAASELRDGPTDIVRAARRKLDMIVRAVVLSDLRAPPANRLEKLRMIPTDREPTPPGEMLQEEFIKPLGLTQAELAEKLGMPRVAVNAIINGKRSITPGTAMRLAKALSTTPRSRRQQRSLPDVATDGRAWRQDLTVQEVSVRGAESARRRGKSSAVVLNRLVTERPPANNAWLVGIINGISH